MPLTSGDKFWMVWSPRGGRPTAKHLWLDKAVSEAERLSKKYPGRHFYVMEHVGFAMEGPEIPTEGQARRAAALAAKLAACQTPESSV
jgi:hypothetical protein